MQYVNHHKYRARYHLEFAASLAFFNDNNLTAILGAQL